VAGALAVTVPMFTGPVAFNVTDALGQLDGLKQLAAVAVTLFAFSTVSDPLMKTCALPVVVFEVAVRLDAASTRLAKTVPLVAVRLTVPVLSMTPALTLVPESATFPAAAVMFPVLTPCPAVAVTAPPLVVMLEVKTPDEVDVSDVAPLVLIAPRLSELGAVAVKLAPDTAPSCSEVVEVALTAPAPAFTASDEAWIAPTVEFNVTAPPEVAIVAADGPEITGALSETAPPAVVMFALTSSWFGMLLICVFVARLSGSGAAGAV
jgi:hypothetical protein